MKCSVTSKWYFILYILCQLCVKSCYNQCTHCSSGLASHQTGNQVKSIRPHTDNKDILIYTLSLLSLHILTAAFSHLQKTHNNAFNFMGTNYFNARVVFKAKRHPTGHLVSSVEQSQHFFHIFSFISKVCNKNNGIFFHIKITMKKEKHCGHRMLTVIKHKSLSSSKMHSIYCHVISPEDIRQLCANERETFQASAS